jgi:GTP-binding protein
VIHGTRLQELPESYTRFLARFFQRKLNLHGTPLQLEFKNTENPYD